MSEENQKSNGEAEVTVREHRVLGLTIFFDLDSNPPAISSQTVNGEVIPIWILQAMLEEASRQYEEMRRAANAVRLSNRIQEERQVKELADKLRGNIPRA